MAVKRRAFREDLFYRLNVVHIRLSALRDRREDVRPLAEKFLKAYAAKHGCRASKFSDEALALFDGYEFPGNVRELANIVERAVIVSENQKVEVEDLPEAIRAAVRLQAKRARRLTLAELEDEYVRETLAAAHGNKSEAARLLGISRKNLYERLARQSKDKSGTMMDEK
jgi:DNA-binding NtrC family response regulator